MVNQAKLILIGRPLEQVLGRLDSQIFEDQETAKLIMENDQLAIASGKTEMIEERIITPKGEKVFLSAKTPFYNTNGEICGVIGISHEIWGEVSSEETLKASVERYRRLVAGSQNIIYSLSNKRIGIYANKYAEQILGYPSEYLSEHPSLWHDSIHPDDLPIVESELEQAYSKNSSELSYRIKDMADNWHWVYDRSIGTAIIGKEKIVERIAVDITNLKQAEEKLIEINAAKDRFFSVLAHDLRSPFTGFIGLTEILDQESDSISHHDLKEIAKSLNESANSIYTLLTDLLTWAKLQMGNIVFLREAVDLYDLVVESVYRTKKDALKKGITIKLNVKPGFFAECDMNMISSVIRNLLYNSVKFTNVGGEIDISIISHDNEHEVIVKDNGVGMKQDKIDKLFLIGENFSTLGTANEKGSGLGLILCKEFIEKHGGTLHASCNTEKGCTFSFTLPKSKCDI